VRTANPISKGASVALEFGPVRTFVGYDFIGRCDDAITLSF
jgi:hypothetical protein